MPNTKMMLSGGTDCPALIIMGAGRRSCAHRQPPAWHRRNDQMHYYGSIKKNGSGVIKRGPTLILAADLMALWSAAELVPLPAPDSALLSGTTPTRGRRMHALCKLQKVLIFKHKINASLEYGRSCRTCQSGVYCRLTNWPLTVPMRSKSGGIPTVRYRVPLG